VTRELVWLRSIAGLLIAPGVPAGILVHLFPGSDGIALSAGILAISAYLTALVLGLPIHILLERHSSQYLAAYALAGGAVGTAAALLTFGVWATFSWGAYPEHAALLLRNSWRVAVSAAVYGTVSGSLFWLLAVWRPGSPK
jgi:hypothetical protein